MGQLWEAMLVADPGRPQSPAAGSGKARAAKAAADDGLVIASHRDLVRHRTAMVKALRERPELLPLLLLNPVLAFRDAGVRMSPAVASHVLHSIQHPPAVRAERDELTATLRERLGVVPHPTDPVWLARTVFTRLKVPPLDTSGHRPSYRPAIPDDARERLQALLPRRTRRPLEPLPDTVARPAPLRRLDLDAPLVTCPPARTAPAELELEQLWFYRGGHELVRPLLRLGVIERGALPVLSADAYRKVRSGKQRSDLLSWVDGVDLPTRARRSGTS